MAAFLAAIIGGFNQVRGAILGGVILGILDNLSAAYLSSQYRGGLSLADPDRRDLAASARAARPRRGADGMNRLGAIAVVARRGIAAVAAPFFLKPFGIYLISMWAVLTIAAIGLNLTLGYAGQVSMAQGAFVGIGAYTLALLTQAGFPYPLAFIAAGLLCFAIGWVSRLSGAARSASLSRLRDARVHHAGVPVLAQRRMADQRHLRHQRDRAADVFRLVHRTRASISISSASACLDGSGGGDVVDVALALGPRLRRAARKPYPRAVARPRYAPLHADGLCHRLKSWRPVGRAICAAGAIHRAELVRARRCRSICC